MSDRPTAELILAPAACGKTAAVIARLRQPRAGRALALVPSREQQRAFYQRIGDRRAARVVQFYQLAGVVLDRAGGAPGLLGDAARLALTRALLSELHAEGRLPFYAAVAHKRGFVAAVAGLLADLASADIGPQAFLAAARTRRDAGLADVYARYVAFQERRGVADLSRRLMLARDALLGDEGAGTEDQEPALSGARGRATTEPGPQGRGPLGDYELLVVDGFDQFTPLQLSLLAALARHIPRVAITLTLDERPRPAQRRFARTFDDLSAALDLRVARLEATPPHYSQALRHLQAHVFDLEGLPPVPASGAVIAIEAADREREIRAVLRRVGRLIAAGTPAGEIAVLYRDGAAYAELLREVAGEYGLPLDVQEGLPLAQAAPVAALLGLMRLPLDDYPRASLIEALRSPYLDGGPTAGDEGRRTEDEGRRTTDDRRPTTDDQGESLLLDDRRSVVGGQWSAVGDLLGAVARHQGIVGGLERWRAALTELAAPLSAGSETGEAGESALPVSPAQAGALLDALERFCAWAAPPERATVPEYVAWAGERSATLRLDDPRFEARDRLALERLGQLLREMERAASLLEAPPLPLRAFLDDLADAVAAARYRLRVAGGVAAMPILAARGMAFAHVAILGLSEGEFPQPLQEPPIYRRAERRALREERGLPLPTPDPADEQTIFYEAIARARQGLMLARTRLDEQGNPLPRSPYLAAALGLLDGVEIAHIPAGGVAAWEEAASPQERALALVEALSQATGCGPQDLDPATYDVRLATLRLEYPAWDHTARARAVEAGREGLGSYGPFEGAIDDAELAAEIARRFGPQHCWSVTEFNDYITCPFRFAAAHVLRLEPRREAADALDGGQRGQIYHAILANAGARWQAEHLALAPEREAEAMAALDVAIQEVLDAAPERFGFAPSAFWPWERDEMRRRLRAGLRGFIRSSGADWQAFTPAALEQGFGGRRGKPPLRLETPAGPALVQGRVDRIDRRADGALAVVDYKSGGARSARATLDGRDVQLPVYVMAVEQVLAAGQQVERAAFFQIGSGRRGGELKGQQLREALDAARDSIAETIAGVRAADFRVRPRDTCPDFCPFEAICRRNLEKRAV